MTWVSCCMSKKTDSPTYRPPVLNRDHARPRNQPAPANAAIEAEMTNLVGPATLALTTYYQSLGLRARILTLPITVAVVLALIWRQIPSVSELTRLVHRERVLWAPLLAVSQQAISLRLRCMPAELFARILEEILPRLRERATARTRPLAPVITRALGHFGAIWIIDATTLEELFRKVGGLRDAPTAPLAGKLLGVLDLPSKLPIQLWVESNPSANAKSFLDRVKTRLSAGTLLLFDAGFYAFPWFDWLTEHEVAFVSRARELAAYQISAWHSNSASVRDCVIQLGQYRSNPCVHPVRLIEVSSSGVWHRYLTNVLDPTRLPARDVVELYGYRWRIEEAFLLAKRLLGLAYLWTGAFNGVCLQLWATWLLYAVLVDLSDAIAQELTLPLEKISLEMVYRGLYHFTVASQNGTASDPVAYLATQTDLGIVKRRRKYRERARLDKMPPDLNL
jgi:Transposase DDE domain